MKLTQMIEKFAKQGMLNGVARAELLQAAEETEQEMAELQEALSGKDGEKQKNGGSGKSHSGGRRQKREGDSGTA